MIGVDIMNQLPQHLQRIYEFQQIAGAYEIEITLLWETFNQIRNNQYLDSMDEYGCMLSEKLLGIVPLPDDSLIDRRRRIKGYYTSSIPYTENRLTEVLVSMCGKEGFTFLVDRENQIVNIGIMLESLRLMDNVKEIADKIIPANMIRNIYVVYNRWIRFQSVRWGDVTEKTWEDLRSSAEFQTGEQV